MGPGTFQVGLELYEVAGPAGLYQLKLKIEHCCQCSHIHLFPPIEVFTSVPIPICSLPLKCLPVFPYPFVPSHWSVYQCSHTHLFPPIEVFTSVPIPICSLPLKCLPVFPYPFVPSHWSVYQCSHTHLFPPIEVFTSVPIPICSLPLKCLPLCPYLFFPTIPVFATIGIPIVGMVCPPIHVCHTWACLHHNFSPVKARIAKFGSEI